MKEDFISQLPDAILVSIVGRMLTKDAVRTSILSTRWKNLYKFAPNVTLWCRCLVQGNSTCPHDMNVFINEVDRFLRLRSGSKIRSLMLNCCLMKSNTDRFEQFMFSLGRFISIERVLLICSLGPHGDFSFSSHLISQMPSLTFLNLWFGSLKPITQLSNNNNNNNNNYSSPLQVLRLNGVTVLNGALECFLSNCSSLHSLSIGICKLPPKLSIRGPNLQLKNLMIDGGGTDEIEFHAPNLVNFEFMSDRVVKFVFVHVPKLQNIFLDFQNKCTMSYVCTKLVQDLPHLKSLMFATKGDIYQVSSRTMGLNAFADLRKLSLSLYSTDGVNLILLVPFLQMCPLLQEFHMNTKCVEYVDRGEAMRLLDVELVIHAELKKVEISGHVGTQPEIEFALYILKSATSLEQMQIIRCPKSYKGCGRWNVQDEAPWDEEALETIHGQLQGQAISKNARLAIQHRPALYENEWRKYDGPVFGKT